MMSALSASSNQSLKAITGLSLHMVKQGAVSRTLWWASHKILNCEVSSRIASPTSSVVLTMSRREKDSWFDAVTSKFTTRRFTICWSTTRNKDHLSSSKLRKTRIREFLWRTYSRSLWSRFPKWKPWWIKVQIIGKQRRLLWILSHLGVTRFSPFISRRLRRLKKGKGSEQENLTW